MKSRVYIETTIVSYLTARPSRDIVIAGRQQDTRDWWNNQRGKFELCTSNLVLDEVASGDSSAARERSEILKPLIVLHMDDTAANLADALIEAGAVPKKAAEDALHIAIAVTNGVHFLLTWNCSHIANVMMRGKIDAVCRRAGFQPTAICTPVELMWR